MKTSRSKNYYYLPLLVFLISRIVLFFIGVRFQAGTINTYLQFIDPHLLLNNLFQSLFYLHAQPPLFNLFLGLVLKLFPDPNVFEYVFHFIFTIGGGVLLICLLYLMRVLNIHRGIAWVLSILFMVSPPVIYYENWLSYDYPLAILLCLSVVLLFRYLSYRRMFEGLLFFLVLAVMALTKSTFHLFWFVLCAGFLKVATPRISWKTFFKMALIPFLLIFAVYVKNLLLFGSLTTSATWMGQHAAEMTMQYIPENYLAEWRDRGLITAGTYESIAADNLNSFWNEYCRKKDMPKTGIPILDQAAKEESGNHNWNNLAHLVVAKQQKKDAVKVFWMYPCAYLTSVKWAFFDSFFPGPTDVRIFNRDILGFYEILSHPMFFHLNKINKWKIFYHDDLRHLQWDGWSMVAFIMVIFYYIIITLFGVGSSLRIFLTRSFYDPKNVVLIFIMFHVIFIILINNMMGYIANNRYRFTIDPFFLILTGMLCTKIFYYFRKSP